MGESFRPDEELFRLEKQVFSGEGGPGTWRVTWAEIHSGEHLVRIMTEADHAEHLAGHGPSVKSFWSRKEIDAIGRPGFSG